MLIDQMSATPDPEKKSYAEILVQKFSSDSAQVTADNWARNPQVGVLSVSPPLSLLCFIPSKKKKKLLLKKRCHKDF